MKNIRKQVKKEMENYASRYEYDGSIKGLCWFGETVDELIDKVTAAYIQLKAEHPTVSVNAAVQHYFN